MLSSLRVSRTGSASDWCALQEALYKCIDTIQYNMLAKLVKEGHLVKLLHLPLNKLNSYFIISFSAGKDVPSTGS